MLVHLHECGYNRMAHDLVHISNGGKNNLFCIHGGNGFAGDFVSPSMQVNDNSLANDISSLTYPSIDDDDDNAIIALLFGDNDHNRQLLADKQDNIWQTVYQHIDEFEVDLPVFRKKVIMAMQPIDMERAVPDFENSDVRKLLYYVNLIRSFIYGGQAYTENRIVNAEIQLFSPDNDKMVENIEQNAACWQGHTTKPLKNYIFPGDHSSWYETGRNGEFLEVFERVLDSETSYSYGFRSNETASVQKGLLKNIFITGSTGFLGAHILDEYLSTESGIAYCLVRGQNQADSEKRLQDVICYYFGDKYQDCSRIKVVCGDITDGISCDADIDMVIHSAALVKHYGSYNESYKINAIGTQRVIDFAKTKNAKLIHISTLSVSGNGGTESNGEKVFAESDFYIGQTLDNVYARTKFEAEKLVLDAINKGLEANICRMGNLSNRYTDAVFQPNYTTNAFLLRLKAILELGMIPESMANYAIEFTPIDYAAKAVMCIASRFNLDRTVFHISNPKVLPMPLLSQILQAFGIQLKVVPDAVFADALKGMTSADAEVYKTINLVFTMDQGSMRLYDSHIHIKNELTVNYLQSLGFAWCNIDEKYLGKWIAYFRNNGFILTLN